MDIRVNGQKRFTLRKFFEGNYFKFVIHYKMLLGFTNLIYSIATVYIDWYSKHPPYICGNSKKMFRNYTAKYDRILTFFLVFHQLSKSDFLYSLRSKLTEIQGLECFFLHFDFFYIFKKLP